MFETLKENGFQVEFLSHAKAILSEDFPEAVKELETVLADVKLPIEEVIGSGGGETKGTQRLRRALASAGWPKGTFRIEKKINDVTRESISHEIDHVRTFDNRGVIALEIEWNNKDPFFDRDLENFKRLHSEGAISVGVIITRGTSLQDSMRDFVLRFAQDRGLQALDDLAALELRPTKRQSDTVTRLLTRDRDPLPFPEAWSGVFVADKYGAATTHWRKLEDRVHRGVGNPCPLLLIGLPASIVTFGETDVDAEGEPVEPFDPEDAALLGGDSAG
ncbi:BglII/BstYI family type II restriction endonuclease [Microbaculum marinum]|uniref:BglII/BstYI family type II restriction endonuclease n=1 Tax=Microbaculum marinum TaxID=1764581 RepID=A0AAW9RLT6_9HYPH